MQITRRKFLSVIGAGALVASAPSGLLAAAGQVSSSSAAGIGHYAVVSRHATWGIYETMAHAHREAELIRHSGAILTNAVQCSPDMVRQYQLGKLGGFVELDGWALTKEEAKSRGLDMVRRATNRSSVRQQLLDHHLKMLRKHLEDFDDDREDAHHYARTPDGSVILGVYDDPSECPVDARLFRCSKPLAEAILEHVHLDAPEPAISRQTGFHILQDEHDARIKADVVYQLSVSGVADRGNPAKLIGPSDARFVAVAGESNWIFGAGITPDQAIEMAEPAESYFGGGMKVLHTSQCLGRAVMANGYEISGFWELIDGVAHHEIELKSL